MKRILALLLAIGAFYLSSCSKSDTPITNPVIIPKSDSVTKGGYLQITFTGKSFYIKDLTVQGSPIYSLSANTLPFDHTDTLWISQLQLIDHKAKQVAMNLTVYKDSTDSTSNLGTYRIRTNTSTVTDNSEGKNKVYAVSLGSTVKLTHTDFTTEGTLALTLHYNDSSFAATGYFKIYN